LPAPVSNPGAGTTCSVGNWATAMNWFQSCYRWTSYEIKENLGKIVVPYSYFKRKRESREIQKIQEPNIRLNGPRNLSS
jgi:hypothetical protein